MTRKDEAPEVKILGLSIFPYSTPQLAMNQVNHANEHFGLKFNARKIGERYILVSYEEGTVLDARGYVISLESHLPNPSKACKKIRGWSSLVESSLIEPN